MDSSVVTSLFLAALVLSTIVRLWLATRQMRHVALHRAAVPAAFTDITSLAAHQKAADYTLAKGRLGLLSMAVGTAVLIGWTLLGGLDLLNVNVRDWVQPRWGDMAYQLALLASFTAIGSLIELPFALYSTFRLEARFGFNRMTWRLYVTDSLKDLAIGVCIGLPIAALILWIIGNSGGLWWLWAWVALSGVQLLAMVLYPTFIAPLYNRFKPLDDAALVERVRALMTRCGFALKGLFEMDGSKRSAHSNAYFTGLGATKRVVFFDTLLAKLTPNEMEAVLAHELGHFKHKHLTKRLVMVLAISLAGFALLGWLAGQVAFYEGLGARISPAAPNDALALLLFSMTLPVFGFFVSPLFAHGSRRDEFQADAYASQQTSGADLASALLKLHQDNAATLTPDPMYVRFYYSHPATPERLAALKALPG